MDGEGGDAAGSSSADARTPWGQDVGLELLAGLPDPVIGCDSAGVVFCWSAAARKLYGYSATEAVGRRLVDLLSTELPLPELEMVEALADLGCWEGRLVHYGKDGVPHIVESRWTSRYDDAGTPVGSVGIEREVPRSTEPVPERRAGPTPASPEVDRQRADRLESLGQLAGGVAHDFNNALAIIINYAALLDHAIARLAHSISTEDRDAMRGEVAEITAAAERAVSITHELLAFSSQEVGTVGSLSLNDVIADATTLLQRTVGEHIEVVCALSPTERQVSADPALITQLLINLAANARDAMPVGGTLTIATSEIAVTSAPAPAATASADDDVTATAGATATADDAIVPGTYIRLTVTDTGLGMLPQVLGRAFDPFFTTKPVGRGSGLGLSSVYGIVSRAGGYAELHSEPGSGTEFVALWPVVDETDAREVPPAPPPHDDGSSAGQTILLVEDEPALRTVVERILADHGYAVITAVDARDALRIIEDTTRAIDLMLTDIVMPHMLGPQLGDRLHLWRPATRVLYMSGFSKSARYRQSQIDPADVIEKPFTPDVLLRRVRTALASPR